MRLPKLRELGEAIKALVKGPYTVEFPRTPLVPHANFRGMPEFNAERCVGCLACEQVCPADAIAHRDVVLEPSPGVKKAKRILIHYADTCIVCGQCEAACIAGHEGIKATKNWDLAFFDRSQAWKEIEKELELCEICGVPVACTDHLEWIGERVGELSYANPTLYLAHYKRLGLFDAGAVAAMKNQGAADRFKILCARCRRETTQTTPAG